MYLRTIATAAVAGFLLIGCSEQSSVNAPIQEAGSLNKGGSSATLSSISGTIEVREMVTDHATGEAYIVSGNILYDLSKSSKSYDFFHRAELHVYNADVSKKQESWIGEKVSLGGESEEPVVVLAQEYQLAEIPGAPVLRLRFDLDESSASLQGVEIETLSPSSEEAR